MTVLKLCLQSFAHCSHNLLYLIFPSSSRKKDQKKNRKKIQKKERVERYLAYALVCLVCAGIIGFIGYSGYGVYEEQQKKAEQEMDIPTTQVDLTALMNFSADEAVEEK